MATEAGYVKQQTTVTAVYTYHYKDLRGRAKTKEIDLGPIADSNLSESQLKRARLKVYARHPGFALRQRKLAKELADKARGGY